MVLTSPPLTLSLAVGVEVPTPTFPSLRTKSSDLPVESVKLAADAALVLEVPATVSRAVELVDPTLSAPATPTPPLTVKAPVPLLVLAVLMVTRKGRAVVVQPVPLGARVMF